MGVNLLYLGAVGLGAVVLAIAERERLFAKHGVDVQLVPVTGTQIPDLTASNPMGYIGAPAALMRAAGGADLKILASFDRAALSGGLVVRRGYSRPEHLKGKRLGARVTGAAMWLHTVLALEKLGLDPSHDGIEIAEIGDPVAVVAALEAQEIDGAVLSRAQCEQLVAKGFAVLLDLAPQGIQGAPDALVVRDEFLRRSPEEPKRVIAAMIEAAACAMSPARRPVVLQAIQSTLGLTDPVAMESAIRELRECIALKPYPSVERLSDMQRLMAGPRPAVASVIISQVVDRRFVEALDTSGFIDRTCSSYGIAAH